MLLIKFFISLYWLICVRYLKKYIALNIDILFSYNFAIRIYSNYEVWVNKIICDI